MINSNDDKDDFYIPEYSKGDPIDENKRLPGKHAIRKALKKDTEDSNDNDFEYDYPDENLDEDYLQNEKDDELYNQDEDKQHELLDDSDIDYENNPDNLNNKKV